jgi:hypothetical protein
MHLHCFYPRWTTRTECLPLQLGLKHNITFMTYDITSSTSVQIPASTIAFHTNLFPLFAGHFGQLQPIVQGRRGLIHLPHSFSTQLLQSPTILIRLPTSFVYSLAVRPTTGLWRQLCCQANDKNLDTRMCHKSFFEQTLVQGTS